MCRGMQLAKVSSLLYHVGLRDQTQDTRLKLSFLPLKQNPQKTLFIFKAMALIVQGRLKLSKERVALTIDLSLSLSPKC